MNQELPQQDGDELLQSAQQMFEKLKSLVSSNQETLSKNILTSLKKQIDTMYDDVHKSISDTVPNTSACVESAGDRLGNGSNDSMEISKNIKTEPDECKIGKIQVKSLSLLLDPNRQNTLPISEGNCIILSSDSEDEPVASQRNNTEEQSSIDESKANEPFADKQIVTNELLLVQNANSEKSFETSEQENNTMTPPSVEKNQIKVPSEVLRDNAKEQSKVHKNRKEQCKVQIKNAKEESRNSKSNNFTSETSPCSENFTNCDLVNLTNSAEDLSLNHSAIIKEVGSSGGSDSESIFPETSLNADASEQAQIKSILKSPMVKSPLKNVKFAEGVPSLHTYPLPPVSESSSSTESNSDEDILTIANKKKITRSKVVYKDVQINEHIKQDKKFFSKCVVNVQRFSPDSLSNLFAKGREDEIRTPKIKRVDDMGGLKRKRAMKESSDSAQPTTMEKKKPKATEEASDSDQNEASYEGALVATSKLVRNGDRKNAEETTSREAHSSRDSGDSDDEGPETMCIEPDVILASSDAESENKTENTKDESESDRRSSDSEYEKVTAKGKKQRGRSKRVLSDSDDSAAENVPERKNVSSDESDNEEVPVKKTKKRSRIKKVDDSSDEEKSTRKQLRKVISRDSLADSTKEAEKAEAARKARIAERQEKYNNIFDPSKLENSLQAKVVLDFNEDTQEELLSVDKALVKHLKPHQGKGIQFMWNACYESLERSKNTKGSGCILAHCMGLGKTLQVIGLSHTLLQNVDKTGVNKVLVVCPLSTVLNWVAEFKKWLPDEEDLDVYNLVSLKQNSGRAAALLNWHKHGGVMVVGYDMFRNLSNETNKRVSKKMRMDFQRALVDPGPDLVVCDEGHLLKNEKTTLSKAMNRIKTLRRIVLTGTPLQNNLKEYYCMVQFVKPNLLGTYKEYLNRFVNPITNGQYTDSTQNDICIMRRRSHVLHKLLDGTVQRRDYAVLAPFLPPKYEYVVFISLTDVQRSMYQHYLINFAQRSSGTRTSFLFTDFQELQRICTHPRVMLDKSIQNKLKADMKGWEDEDDSEGSIKDFIDDGSESASSTTSDGSSDEGSGKETVPPPRRRTRATADKDADSDTSEPTGPDEWWSQFTQTDELDNIIHSGKLSLLFEILHQCELIGDKVLVFSQSLLSLNIIEYFLARIDEAGQNGDSSLLRGYSSSWSLGADYFRLDGSSSCDNRAAWCKTFNDPSNTQARLFLISTRAGGLGINLVAANRVIIFDVSWNPSHDIQSIYRVYRFGQTKPSYIYRFVTLGTMEMKVYERQVTKQAISKRVIDEQQIDRHYNQNDLQELYKFEPLPSDRPLPAPPKDILLGELLQSFTDIIFKYHEHQSLLENKEDEVLNEEERKAAWEEFENEKQMQRNTSGTINNIPMHTVVLALTSIVKREHPGVTQLEINGVMPQLINQLREHMAQNDMTMFNKMLAEIRAIKAAEQARVQEYYKTQQQALWMAQQMQKQFPGLSQADAEKILRDQMNHMHRQSQLAAAGPMQSTMELQARTINPSEVVNLDED